MKKLKLEKVLPWLLIIFGGLALAAAIIITIEKIDLLQNPNHKLICDLNPVISCGSVMDSKQSHIFGFSNSLIGIAAFPVIVATGAAILAGARLKRWYWLGLQAGTIFGLGFVHWLFFQSVYRINALCPYCMVVWACTITIFWYVTLYNFQMGHIRTPARLIGLMGWVRRHHLDILVLWFIVIIALILKHFWYYYSRYL